MERTRALLYNQPPPMPISEEFLLALIESNVIRPQARNAFITALVLAGPMEYARLWGLIGRKAREGRLAGDDALFRDIYRKMPQGLRVQLMASFASSVVGARTFKRLFEEVFLDERTSKTERAQLARAFSRFFALRQEAPAGPLEQTIRLLLRSKEGQVRMHALLLVDRLKRMGEDDLRIILRDARSRSRMMRSNAWWALSALARKPGGLRPEVVAGLRELGRTLMEKPDEDARTNIKWFLSFTGPSGARPPSRVPGRRS